MSEKSLTYSDACKEVARHGVQHRLAMRKRNFGRWIPPKPIASHAINVTPNYPPASLGEHNLEQTILDFK
jgi:hypothetical protein